MNRMKQIAIALIGLILLFALGYGAFKVFGHFFRSSSAPSCFDGIKNQDEAGIDCGGVCKSCEVVKDLTLFNAQAIPTKAGFVDLLGEVRNENLNYGVPSLRYSFEMYGANGKLMGKKDGVTFVLPNSTKYIVAQAIPAQDNPAQVKLTFDTPSFQEVKNYVKPRLTALNVSFDIADTGFLRARGAVSNQTDFNFNKVYLVAILRDDAQRVITVNSQEINSLVSNEKRFFELGWGYRAAFFTNSEIQVDTNIFDLANSY